MHKLCPKFCADASADHKHLTGETFINVMTRRGKGCFHGVFRCRCCTKTDTRKRTHMTGESEGGKGERFPHVTGTRVTKEEEGGGRLQR